MLTIKKLRSRSIDISLIFSRVIVLQLANKALKVENVFSFELYPIPTLLFRDTGNMSSKKFTSSFSDTSKNYHFGK